MAVVVALDTELDSRVAEYEAARSGQGCANIADFLPDERHPRYLDILVELVRVDMEFAWQSSAPPTVDDYIVRFPILLRHESALQAICFEDYRQRRQAGQAPDAAEYNSRYRVVTTHWPSATTSTQVNSERRSGESGPPFPQVGETFLGFRLERELGRGAFARVYLATQGDLAARPVALKISRARFSDAATLARLQHTHIVPIYSVHREGIWEAVCMPYFGACTLADLIRAVRERASPPLAGRFIYDTIAAAGSITPDERDIRRSEKVPSEGDSPRPLSHGFQELAELDYVHAVLWLMRKIALALEHAHERGIVHRDLKPANILLSDDGEPMLLDFNLADDSLAKKIDSRDFSGGTLPYMSLEQLRAFELHQPHRDARCDLFALGVVMHELLLGRLPHPVRTGVLREIIAQSITDRQTAKPVRAANRGAITPAVAAIVNKCLAASPAERYQTAAAFAEDLDRQLNHLPLLHVREPSLTERTRKWVRRHPRLVSASGITLLAGVTIMILACLMFVRGERLAQFQAQEDYHRFEQDFTQARLALTTAALDSREQIEASVASCEQALAHFSLQTSLQPLPPLANRLSAPERKQLRENAAELHFLVASAQAQRADFADNEQRREAILQEALKHNEVALESFTPDVPPRAFQEQSAWLRRSLRLAPREPSPPTTCDVSNPRDVGSQAFLLMQQRRFQEAIPLWRQASRKTPDQLWVWYGLGYCLEQRGAIAQAAECYSVCSALDPRNFSWYFQRGRLRMSQREYDLARDDFLTALQLRANHAESQFNLAITFVALGDNQLAIKSARGAIELGYRDPRVYSVLAEAFAAEGNAAAALDARRQAAAAQPTDANSWVARGVAQAASSPSDALTSFDTALQLNAHSLSAWESKAHVQSELLGQSLGGIATLEQAIEYFPEQATLWASRGVLYARLEKAELAVRDAEKALSLEASPAILYQCACVYALLSDSSPAHLTKTWELLASALRQGYGGDFLPTDKDLDKIRQLPEFQRLVGAVQAMRPASQNRVNDEQH